MTCRQASHAGSWYSSSSKQLDTQLSSWLAAVPSSSLVPSYVVEGGEKTYEPPVQGAKALIGPHAGYSYSGPSAAWAYKAVEPSRFNRVIILGPSHKYYLDGCALSRCETYETPIGSLPVDLETTQKLKDTGKFSTMSLAQDENEHSLEMHLPLVRKVFTDQKIQIVPILVGSISKEKEAEFGQLLAPYLDDPKTFTIVSSDFCHWGSRFDYTYYRPADPSSSSSKAYNVSSSKPASPDVPIHKSIEAVDKEGMSILERGEGHEAWAAYLKRTKNTVCGRHPIGVLLAALAHCETTSSAKPEISFTRYEQSSACVKPTDSSVSYASAWVRW